MTVCIAAVAKDSGGASLIVLAADRMLTVGDYEYEPAEFVTTPKIYTLTNHIAMLIAGSVHVQVAVGQAATLEIRQRGITEVQAAAEILAKHYRVIRRQQAERKFLEPLGLTIQSFLDTAKNLPADLVERITGEMNEHDLRSSAIITGVESNGWSHIYRVTDPGQMHCDDGAGFSVIGYGQRLASNEFMARGYGADIDILNALPIIYAAKRRAERAPGVGTATDWGLISKELGSVPMPADVISILKRNYDRAISNEKRDLSRQSAALRKLIAGKDTDAKPRDEKEDNRPDEPGTVNQSGV